MKVRRILGAAAAAAIVVITGSAASASAQSGITLNSLRDVTNQYHNISVAEQAGYGLLTDVNGIACISDDMGMGAMGVHYANGGLVGDGKITPFKPEALLYAADKQGTLHLSGVEYVVLKDAWLQNHKHAPKLFGQTFNFTPAGNRFGLPDFYSLHVWAWKNNPAGTFEMFNPTVHCPA